MRTPVSRIEKLAGLFIILAIVVFGAILFFPQALSGKLLSSYQLRIVADDGLGITVGNEVIMRGIQIGEVSNLTFDPTNRVFIDCRIYRAFRDRLTEGLRVELVPPALFGSPVIRLLSADLTAAGPKPLAPDAVLKAEKQTSITEQLSAVSGDVRRVFDKVENRIEQLGENLGALQKILDSVNAGEGLAGRLLRDRKLADDAERIVTQLQTILSDVQRTAGRIDQYIAELEKMGEPLEDFATVLPKLKEDLLDIGAKLRSSLTSVDKGLERFPDMATDTAFALEDARRILESFKRNFFIRGNLPRDGSTETLAPLSPRDAPAASWTKKEGE